MDEEPPAPLSETPVLVFFVACVLLGGYSGAAIGHGQAGVPGAAAGLVLGLVVPWVPVLLRRAALGTRKEADHRLKVSGKTGPLRPSPKPGPEQWIPALQGGGLSSALALVASSWLGGPSWLTVTLMVAAGTSFGLAGYFSARRADRRPS